MLICTAIIAVATVVYVLYAAKLWRVSVDTLQLTKKIFESTNRPFIVSEEPQLELVQEQKPSFVLVKISNKGRVPSSGVLIEFNVKFENKDAAITHPSIEPLSIFPDFSEQISIEVDNKRNHMIAYLDKPSSPLELFLIIKYNGIADQQYTTNCHYRYDVKLKRFNSVNITWT